MGYGRFAPFVISAAIAGASPAMAQTYEPPPASAALLEDIDFEDAVPVDEDYRAEFKRCDEENVFRGNTLSGWRKCSGDKNNVEALLRLEDGAIYFESKLALDLDGSWLSWNSPGLADLRATWFQWPRTCSDAERDSEGVCQKEQVDSEHVPFIVIPIAGPQRLRKEFQDKTGVSKGDFGVIIYKDKWVPGFVADGGPYNKLGEGSAAALAALGEDRCRRHNDEGFCDRYRDASIEKDVITIIFPGSRRDDLTAENVVATICAEAKERLGLTGAPICGD